MKWTKEEAMDLTGEGVPDFGDVAAKVFAAQMVRAGDITRLPVKTIARIGYHSVIVARLLCAGIAIERKKMFAAMDGDDEESRDA